MSSIPSSPDGSRRDDVERSAVKQKENFFVCFFELDKHIAEEWVQCIMGINPYILATLRLVFFLNTLAALIESFVKAFQSSEEDVGKFFFKLTNISAMALTVYFGLMMFLSFRHARDRTHWGPFRRFVLNSLHFSCWMFQIIIPPIYWFALKGYAKPHDGAVAWWQDYSVHGLGIIFLIIEIIMVRRWYACWLDALVSTGMVLSYMFWMFLAPVLFQDSKLGSDGKKRRWWPYNIYRFGYKPAPLFYLGTLFLCIFVSLIVVALHKLKNRQASKAAN